MKLRYLFAAAFSWVLGPPVLSSELKVPEEHATIQAAIDAAQDGDTVLVGPGTHEVSEPVVFRGKKIKVKSSDGASVTRIALSAPSKPERASLVSFQGAETAFASLEGFTLEGGQGLDVVITPIAFQQPFTARVGGAIYCGTHAEPRIKDCVFRNNSAEYGGAVFCDSDSAPVFSGNVFESNRALKPSRDPLGKGRGGAIACMADSSVTIGGGAFVKNEAEDGGAVYASDDSTLELISVRFEENLATTDDGGAVLARSRKLRVFNSTFRKCSAKDSGGGIRAVFRVARPSSASILIDECTFEECSAALGGALELEISPGFGPAFVNTVKVTKSVFVKNSARVSGGAYAGGYETALTNFEDCQFEKNHAVNGGALFQGYDNNLILTRSRFELNSAILGGAIGGNEEGMLTAADCVFLGNVATQLGGALAASPYHQPQRAFQHCTFVGNSSGSGGSCIQASTPGAGNEFFGTINSCIFWGNSGTPIFGTGEITYSLFEADAPAGVGNVSNDPRLAGWAGPEEVFVDSARLERGDGSEASPYRDLGDALTGYQLGLLAGSPCIGTGAAGTNMGADTGLVAVAGRARRSIRLLEGKYDLEKFGFAGIASLSGAGAGRTVATGPLVGLRSGALAEDLSIEGGSPGGIAVGDGESPRIQNCAILCCALKLPEGTETLQYAPVAGQTPFGGWGVFCAPKSSPFLDHVTILGSSSSPRGLQSDCNAASGGHGSGIYAVGAMAILESSIVWNNAGGSIQGTVTASRSCIEAPVIYPGDSNTNSNPKLAAWPSAVAYVDSAAPEGGDGTAARPFRDPATAFESYGLELASGSPCIGSAKDGTNMGASTGVVELAGSSDRKVILGPGTYRADAMRLCLNVSLEGSGAGKTTVSGTLEGPRTGSTISHLTLVGGNYLNGSLSVSACESPTITDVTFERSVLGLRLGDGLPRVERCVFRNSDSSIYASGKSQVILRSCYFEGVQSCIQMEMDSVLDAQNCVMAGCISVVGIIFLRPANPQIYGSFRHCTIGQSGNFAVDCASPATDFFRLENCIIDNGIGLPPCSRFKGSLLYEPASFVQPGVYEFNRFITVDLPGSFINEALPDFIRTPGDYHIKDSSKAIDIGMPDFAVSEDFDGKPRPCGAGVDAGAYEFGSCAGTPFLRGDSNGDSRADLADAVFTLGYLFLGSEAPSCIKSADANDSGALTLGDAVYSLLYLFQGGAAPPEPYTSCGLDPTPDDLPCTAHAACAGV